MITETSTIITVTVIVSVIMALYGAIAGMFYDGDQENPVWYILGGVVVAVALGVNFAWNDRGGELYYQSTSRYAGFLKWFGPALAVMIASVIGWGTTYFLVNRGRRTVGSRRAKIKPIDWPHRPSWAEPRKRH